MGRCYTMSILKENIIAGLNLNQKKELIELPVYNRFIGKFFFFFVIQFYLV